MATNLAESRDKHGKINLTSLIKPIIELIEQNPGQLLQKHAGKIYVITDDIIRDILNNQALIAKIRQEGQLFSQIQKANVIATLHKSPETENEQKKQITLLEDAIYNALQSLLAGKEAEFFGQTALSYFSALTNLANRKMEVGIPQRAIFPDAQLSKEYPGTKAILRVPRHTLQITGDFSEALVEAVKEAMQRKLSKADYPEDEIKDILGTVEQDFAKGISYLYTALSVFEKNAYGRIRRTYACCVLEKMARKLESNSPAIAYSRRVSDFNELVQATLPNSGLSAADLVLEFPNPDGKGVMNFDLMTEFSQAHTLNTLPFWLKFDQLLSESTTQNGVTTSLGQHFKINGKVPSEGFNSVFEFNVDKITKIVNQLKQALATGQNFPSDSQIRKALRVAVLYYVVFRDDPNQSRSALANYKAFKKQITNWTQDHVSLDEILTRIAGKLMDNAILANNRTIRADFKKLLQSRKMDDIEPKEKLYLIIDREILNKKVEDMLNADPIVSPPSEQYDSSYLKFLKVTRHYQTDYPTLLQRDVDFTESLRYLTQPQDDLRKREMVRDLNRNVLGVLFTPRDNDMKLFSLPFKGLTNLFMSYDRQQIIGYNLQTKTKDDYMVGLAQLSYVLIVYGVLKAVERLEGEYQQSCLETTDNHGVKHANRTMLLMLSLFPSLQLKIDDSCESIDVEDRFTHDAHKAIEHLIKQHIPTKSQGFKLLDSQNWDGFVTFGTSEQIKEEAKKYIQEEIKKDWRAANIIEGLASGLEALWQLPEKPSLEKIALMVVTSRACDKTGKSDTGRKEGDRKVMYGDIHRFEYEAFQNNQGSIVHFYRHQPVQAFCDDMDTADSFDKPAVLLKTIRQLYSEGFRDVLVVTKVPFTQRIRMTTEYETSYTNPAILKALHQEMPELRIYPLFTQKSYGVRLPPKKPKQPMFLPHDPQYDEPLPDDKDNSKLFRAASVLTNHVIETKWEIGDKLHSGITDYLFRWYPETVSIQSEAIAALRQPQTQACLYEVLRFLHANANEQSPKTKEKLLDAKLDALETIIGDENLGYQADSLKFPKPQTSKGPHHDKVQTFSINMIALLKHLENQSNQYRK